MDYPSPPPATLSLGQRLDQIGHEATIDLYRFLGWRSSVYAVRLIPDILGYIVRIYGYLKMRKYTKHDIHCKI